MSRRSFTRLRRLALCALLRIRLTAATACLATTVGPLICRRALAVFTVARAVTFGAVGHGRTLPSQAPATRFRGFRRLAFAQKSGPCESGRSPHGPNRGRPGRGLPGWFLSVVGAKTKRSPSTGWLRAQARQQINSVPLDLTTDRDRALVALGVSQPRLWFPASYGWQIASCQTTQGLMSSLGVSP